MADCAPGDGYFDLLDKLFATQKDWIQAANPLDALRALGKEAGIEESKIDGCMTDDKAIDRIAVAYKEAVDVYGVEFDAELSRSTARSFPAPCRSTISRARARR